MLKFILNLFYHFKSSGESFFSVQEEAKRLNMSIDEYKEKVLGEIPKTTLNEIYDMNGVVMEKVNEDKQKFNQEILDSKDRMNDFRELERFMKGLY